MSTRPETVRRSPTSRAIAAAVAGWSPVMMATRIPAPRHRPAASRPRRVAGPRGRPGRAARGRARASLGSSAAVRPVTGRAARPRAPAARARPAGARPPAPSASPPGTAAGRCPGRPSTSSIATRDRRTSAGAGGRRGSAGPPAGPAPSRVAEPAGRGRPGPPPSGRRRRPTARLLADSGRSSSRAAAVARSAAAGRTAVRGRRRARSVRSRPRGPSTVPAGVQTSTTDIRCG